MDKLTIRDVDASGKRVFLRVDFNVPLADGKVTDDQRIRAALPTITALLAQGARIVLASHLGRPDGKVQDGLRLRPVAERLATLLNRNVPVTGDALGIGTEDAVKRLRTGRAAAPREPPLPRRGGEERPRLRGAARLVRRHLRERRVRDGPPRPRVDRRDREDPAGLRGPAHGGRDQGPVQPHGGARPPVRGRRRRGEGLRQDQGPREPPRPRSTCSSWAAAWPTRSCSPRARRSARASPSPTGSMRPGAIMAAAEAKGVPVILPVDVIVAKEVTRGTEYKTLPAEKIPASWHIVDTRPQEPAAHGRGPRAARRPSSGTVRSACSRSPRSPTGPRRWPASWPTRPRPARRSSSAAAIRSPRSSSRAWPTR